MARSPERRRLRLHRVCPSCQGLGLWPISGGYLRRPFTFEFCLVSCWGEVPGGTEHSVSTERVPERARRAVDLREISGPRWATSAGHRAMCSRRWRLTRAPGSPGDHPAPGGRETSYRCHRCSRPRRHRKPVFPLSPAPARGRRVGLGFGPSGLCAQSRVWGRPGLTSGAQPRGSGDWWRAWGLGCCLLFE